MHNCPTAEGCFRTIKATPSGFNKACLLRTYCKKITFSKRITWMRINVDLIVVLARDSMLFRILNFFKSKFWYFILNIVFSDEAARQKGIAILKLQFSHGTQTPTGQNYRNIPPPPPQENISIIFKLSSFMCKCDKQSKEQREKMNNLVMENKKPN